jgi:hypothetical protein
MPSTAAHDLPESASFSARNNPQRIPANPLPVFRACGLAMKDYSDGLLAHRFDDDRGNLEIFGCLLRAEASGLERSLVGVGDPAR